ncbi:hypothetical protein, partial [Candidatus Binatus sp.]|uniref:hypothetical protein n=1 Tax=Candidatus Binatus sp. TaxID=2811406 RepID=UPI003CC61B48
RPVMTARRSHSPSASCDPGDLDLPRRAGCSSPSAQLNSQIQGTTLAVVMKPSFFLQAIQKVAPPF